MTKCDGQQIPVLLCLILLILPVGSLQELAADISFSILNYFIFIIPSLKVPIASCFFLLPSLLLTNQPLSASLVFSSPPNQQLLPKKAMPQLCSTGCWAESTCMEGNLQRLAGGNLLFSIRTYPTLFPLSFLVAISISSTYPCLLLTH